MSHNGTTLAQRDYLNRLARGLDKRPPKQTWHRWTRQPHFMELRDQAIREHVRPSTTAIARAREALERAHNTAMNGSNVRDLVLVAQTWLAFPDEDGFDVSRADEG